MSKSSEADKIWEEIKGIQLDLFSLPDQTVEKHCKPATIDPGKLYLTISASAVFPALDEVLKDKFEIEQVGKWYVVSRKA